MEPKNANAPIEPHETPSLSPFSSPSLGNGKGKSQGEEMPIVNFNSNI